MRSTVQRCASSLPRLLSRTPIAIRSLPRAQTSCSRSSTIIRCLHQSIPRQQEAAAARAEAPADGKVIYTKFQELADNGIIHPSIVDTLTKDMGLETMTEVQSRTISTTVRGVDCIAQAKTGTGKTIAFLLPVLQNIIKVDPDLARRNSSRRGPRTTADDIRAIIISPTRELAEQIAVEAKRLVAGTSIVVQTAVGGTQKAAGLRAIQRDGCHILVGTPGRLNDIFNDSYTRVEAPDLSALVYDEADRLLDAGFWREIESIQKNLPDPKQVPRQTLMFSATIPTEVVDLVRRIMRPGFAFEQCVRADEEPTHPNVPQHIVATNGLENQLPAVIELCMREIAKAEQPGNRPFKAIVYFSATNEVATAYDALRNLSESQEGGRWGSHPFGRTQIIQIQSRLAQNARTRAANDFRSARSAILLSSDVTARGLDFPDVTHVIQVGVPSNAEQYVHRIGRTARAGKEGEGWLFVDESLQMQTARKLLGRLPIKRDTSLEIPALNLTQALQVSDNAGKILGMLQKSMANISAEQKEDTYRSVIGAYRGGASSDNELVAKVNDLATYGWGLKQIPSMSAATAQKMGLHRVRGLNISNSRPSGDRGGFGNRGGFGDRGGFSERGGFGDRGGFRDRGSFGDRDGRSRSGSGFGGGSRGGYGRSNFAPPRSRSSDSAF